MRQGLRKIPPGRYSFEDQLDDDGLTDDPVKIRLTLVAAGEEITADFTGTDAQRAAPINGSKSMVSAVVYYAIMAAVAPDTPGNEGGSRPSTLIAPAGTVRTLGRTSIR